MTTFRLLALQSVATFVAAWGSKSNNDPFSDFYDDCDNTWKLCAKGKVNGIHLDVARSWKRWFGDNDPVYATRKFADGQVCFHKTAETEGHCEKGVLVKKVGGKWVTIQDGETLKATIVAGL